MGRSVISGKLYCRVEAANSFNPAGVGTCGTSARPSGEVIIPAAMTHSSDCRSLDRARRREPGRSFAQRVAQSL